MRHLIDRAVRIAHTKQGGNLRHLRTTCGFALQNAPVAHGTTHTGIGYAGPAKLPDQASLHAAAEVLNTGKKVAMLVGAGALDATDEVIAVAERLNAGVAKALLGKEAQPDDLPFVAGSLELSDRPSWDLMELRHASDGWFGISLQRVSSETG